MYQFMAEMSPRRQKMLFAAGVYVLWSLAYGLAVAIFSLPDEDISFFLSLGFIVYCPEDAYTHPYHQTLQSCC